MLAGSVAGLATVTGLTGWLVTRRQRHLTAELGETVRKLESRMNEVDEELGVRLNEVDESVEQLRRARGQG